MTRLHERSSLNIFADIDLTMKMLLDALKIKLPKKPKVFMNKKNWRQ
jgi:hypothetical protein